ncbi:hypothetical protein BLA29_001439 [Euroglyphus maynei]|uniref:Uncharacterized protein n=1 Tax=Euroglyphus maynei TaxID=6958 RepID=A0A1Y3ASJ4_EURMA|nr:hypothetical protein BLA29_001439 [Euroglyphus maynei]
MTNIKNENDLNLSTNQSVTTTSIEGAPLPEISLQDLNKQLNAIAQPVVCPIVSTVSPPPHPPPPLAQSIIQTSTQSNIATNLTMAMEGVLDGSYSTLNKLSNDTTANQLAPLMINANHTSMLAETNANSGSDSVTLINPQQSIGLLNPTSNGLELASSDFQMLNIPNTTPTRTDDFMRNNNNSPIIDQIMSTLNQTNSTASVTVTNTNPTATMDSFMQACPNGNGQSDQPTRTEQLSCPMMTNDCTNTLIQTPSTMTMAESLVTNHVTPVNQNVLERQEILDSLNPMNNNGAVDAIGNQLQNIAMAVDPTPSSSNINNNQINTSYCHQENKFDLTSIANTTNTLSQQLNSLETNQQQVFITTINLSLFENIFLLNLSLKSILVISGHNLLVVWMDQSQFTKTILKL